MATTITGITADLRLESAAFIRDLSKAARAVETNTSRMARSVDLANRRIATFAKSVGASIAAFASVQSVQSIARLGMAAIETADNIGDAATRIGTSAESLQRFRYAAEQADVEVSQLDSALKIFIQNFAKGKINVEGNSPIEAFSNYIDKIREAPTFLAKASIAQGAFGKQYETAMQLAVQSGAEFERQYKSAHVTAQRAIDTAAELKSSLIAISNAALTGFQTGFLSAFTGKLGTVETTADRVNEALEAVGRTIGGIATATLGIFNAINKFKQENPRLWEFMFSLDMGFNAGSFEQFPGRGTGPGGGKSVAPLIGPPPTVSGLDLGSAENPLASQAEASTAAMQALNDQISLQRSLVDGLRTPWDDYIDQMARIEEANLAETATTQLQIQAKAALASATLGAVGAMTGALTALFKDNKAIAIANAVINTAEAITAALKNPPGPPWSFAYAAAAAVQGAAQIATIMSAQPGSSKAIRKPAGGSGASARAGDASKGGNGTGDRQTVFLNITGDSFGPEHFRRMVEGLNGALADGAEFRMAG